MSNTSPDVSSYQGYVDWSKVAASGRKLGATKATEGLTWTDPYFSHNWSGMEAQKMMRLAYHFAHPANDPAAEFQHFASVVPQFAVGFGTSIVLDLEMTQGRSAADLVHYADVWGRLAQQHYGVQPGLYSGAYFIHQYLNDPSLVSTYWLWIAAYQKTPPNPSPWSKWLMWQYTDAGSVPGIQGVCDLSVGVPDFFSATPAPLTQEVIMARVPDAVAACPIPGVVNGTWVTDPKGGVFTFGPGPFHGSVPGLGINQLNAPVVRIKAHGQGGYWLVAADGGIFSFGDAPALNVYQPFMNEYKLGVHAILDAQVSDDGNHLILLADDGAHYEIVPV